MPTEDPWPNTIRPSQSTAQWVAGQSSITTPIDSSLSNSLLFYQIGIRIEFGIDMSALGTFHGLHRDHMVLAVRRDKAAHLSDEDHWPKGRVLTLFTLDRCGLVEVYLLILLSLHVGYMSRSGIV